MRKLRTDPIRCVSQSGPADLWIRGDRSFVTRYVLQVEAESGYVRVRHSGSLFTVLYIYVFTSGGGFFV